MLILTAPVSKAQEVSGSFDGGSVKVGYDSRTCSGALEGSVRYNSSTQKVEFCDGSSWADPAGSSCLVYGITFTDKGATGYSQVVTSDIQQMTTETCSAAISISGGGSPEYRVCSEATCTTGSPPWTSAAGTINNGEYLQIRLTSSASANTTLTATPQIESLVTNWGVTTIPNYRIVFITSATYTGDEVGGVTAANQKCQNLADAAGLSGIYLAWIADTTVGSDPDTRFTQSTVEYQLVTGTVVANNWTDLTDGSIDNLIDRDENGTQVTNRQTWTNVSSDGTRYGSSAGNSCSDWTSSGPTTGRYGTNLSTTGTWTDGANNTCVSSYSLYCFQQDP